MAYVTVAGVVGGPQTTPYNLPDTTSRMVPGFIYDAVDSYWGGGEFLYCKANGSIRQFGLVVITQTFASGQAVYNATEVPNTANLGRTLGVAMVPASAGQFLMVQISGLVPVNCNAAVAADTTFGIAAAGQGGANSAGKQILNARVVVASSQTVAKIGNASAGSTRLTIPGSEGWFAGIYLSGTGIQAGTTVTDIDASGTQVTLSLATSAAVNGATITGTYNNATVFYNVAHINRPFAQGAIT